MTLDEWERLILGTFLLAMLAAAVMAIVYHAVGDWRGVELGHAGVLWAGGCALIFWFAPAE